MLRASELLLLSPYNVSWNPCIGGQLKWTVPLAEPIMPTGHPQKGPSGRLGGEHQARGDEDRCGRQGMFQLLEGRLTGRSPFKSGPLFGQIVKGPGDGGKVVDKRTVVTGQATKSAYVSNAGGGRPSCYGLYLSRSQPIPSPLMTCPRKETLR